MTETSTQKNYLPIIIGTILTLAVLIGGFIFVQKSLTGDSSFKASDNLVRSTNPVIGKKDSNIKFVYLYDYMCPACQSNADNMTSLKSQYSDKITFVYKPYIVHPGSGDRMAHASFAADRQGKFPEFNEKLIKLTPESPSGLSVSQLENVAKEVGLDTTKFVKDYNSKEVEDQLKLDQKDISNTIMPVSIYPETKGSTKIGSTPTIVLLKDDKITSSWWSGVLPLEDSGENKGVKSRINQLLEQK
jgi:hypothetical protein